MLLVTGPAAASAVRARVLFHLADGRIDEASGIALGRASPGIVYVQNDSGGGNDVFAVDERTGATAATITVPGATNVDWEDLAVAAGPAGRSAIWIADIGDNDAVRAEVRVYRVDEPRVDPADRDRAVTATGLRTWRLRYPSGPTDAEGFAVGPDGRGYIVTKSVTGGSVVYRLPARPDAERTQRLRRVASIRLLPTGTANPFGLVGELTVTGAAFSRDGSLFAIRTYADAYVWRVASGDLAAALQSAPTRVALPSQPQGEGVAVDGSRLLLDSEGVRSAVLAVPLPRLPAPAASTPSSTSAPQPTPAGRSVGTPAVDERRGPGGVQIAVAVAVVVLLGALARLVTKRRAG